MVKIIQDPVFGPIKADGVILDLIDSPEFQRLRRIKNLGLCSLVFPGANHTRFEHSIGTYYLASLYNEHLRTMSDELKIAALLHDIGHFPYSHTIEEFYMETEKIDHLQAGINLIEGKAESEIPAILEKHGIDPHWVSSILKGISNVLSEIISGPLDADELDYLRRDSFYCGVSIGYVNPLRIIDVSSVYEGQIVSEEKGLSDIESLLISRFLMYQAVYFHKTCRIANKMLGIAARLAEAIGTSRMVDEELMALLLSKKRSERIARDIINRRLMKVIFKEKYGEELYRDITDRIGEDAIVDVIPPLSFSGRERLKTDVSVKIQGRIVAGEEISPLVNSLNQAIERRYVYVYGYKEDEEKIKSDLRGL